MRAKTEIDGCWRTTWSTQPSLEVKRPKRHALWSVQLMVLGALLGLILGQHSGYAAELGQNDRQLVSFKQLVGGRKTTAAPYHRFLGHFFRSVNECSVGEQTISPPPTGRLARRLAESPKLRKIGPIESKAAEQLGYRTYLVGLGPLFARGRGDVKVPLGDQLAIGHMLTETIPVDESGIARSGDLRLRDRSPRHSSVASVQRIVLQERDGEVTPKLLVHTLAYAALTESHSTSALDMPSSARAAWVKVGGSIHQEKGIVSGYLSTGNRQLDRDAPPPKSRLSKPTSWRPNKAVGGPNAVNLLASGAPRSVTSFVDSPSYPSLEAVAANFAGSAITRYGAAINYKGLGAAAAVRLFNAVADAEALGWKALTEPAGSRLAAAWFFGEGSL